MKFLVICIILLLPFGAFASKKGDEALDELNQILVLYSGSQPENIYDREDGRRSPTLEQKEAKGSFYKGHSYGDSLHKKALRNSKLQREKEGS